MTTNKTKLMLLVTIFLLAPVAVWAIIGVTVGTVDVGEIFTIIFSLQTMLYVMFITTAMLLYFNAKLSEVQLYIDNQSTKTSDEIDKIIAQLPMHLYLGGFLYVVFGSFVALSGRDFLTDFEFTIYNLLSMPVFLLFIVPFFISFFRSFEAWVQKIHLPKNHKSLSFSKRLILSIISSSLGAIWLLVVLNIFLQGQENSSLETTIIKGVSFAVVALVMLLVNVTFILKQTVGPVTRISELFSEDKENMNKKLSIELRDEIGFMMNNINRFFDSIKEILNVAKKTSGENVDVSRRVEDASITIANSVQKQDTLIIEASRKGSDMKVMLDDSLAQATHAKSEIASAKDRLDSMHTDTSKMIQSIQATAQREAELSTNISQLSTDADQIKDVLTVIADIAEQTNLLALNAAIEAARAGEHGRGFAVVADEVRKLAERTQKSLVEIHSTVNIIVQSINDTSTQMDANVEEINKLSHMSQEVEIRLVEMTSSMDQMTQATNNSASSSTTIASETEKIIEEIKEIDLLSKENHESVAQIKQAGNDLKSLTTELDNVLNRLRT